MRKSLQVSLLVLVLAASAYAGDMQCGVTGTPPPPAGIEQAQTADGETPNNADGESPNNAADTFTGAALNLLAGVLALI
ncbi:MAG TPA: hypothetical protein VER76_08285 [Pyrinomonadaceae bacterium]|nr:hypothetical protein [Pyrinomonadaceae bacterium]